MLLKLHSLVLVWFFVSSCMNDAKPKAGVNHEELLSARDTVEIKESDTILISHHQLVFTPATKVDIPNFHEQHGIKISGGQTAFFTQYSKGIGLHLDSGDTLKLMNDSTKAETYHFYALIPGIGNYLIQVQYPEGNSYLLVNKSNGEKVSLLGLPYVSPSKKYIVAVNEDQIAGHSPNAIQVLQAQDNSFRSLFILDIKGWGTEKVMWLSDTSFVLEKKIPVIDTANGKIDFSISYSGVNIQLKHP